MTAYIRKFFCSASVSVLLAGSLAAGPSDHVDSLLRKADSLRCEYEFNKALFIYDEVVNLVDSASVAEVEDHKMLAENGLGMMDFVLTPTVVARHRFSLDEFHLFYPLPDKSWKPLPNILDTLPPEGPVRAMFIPDNASSLMFSAVDSGGSRNIYRTEKKDSLWSVPALLNEYLVSSGDEMYPMLSPDGKYLYFSSDGLYGMGGFDLYVSEWNEEQQEWGPPANMGFPFSSPFNDYLFINTEDWKYSIFASDRDCTSDSVDVYVLEYETMPVRKSVSDAAELRALMKMDPVDDLTKMDNSTAVSDKVPENMDTRRYMEKVAEVRVLQDSIYSCNRSLERKRTVFAESDDADERARLTAEILGKEAELPVLRDSLSRASEQLQKIEMEFLFKGVVLDPEKLLVEADREIEGASSNYVFARMNMGAFPDIRLEEPEKKFDYTFMILPEGRFAEDNTLPEGIVYQIQMFSLSSKASVASLKGLSPVFEEKTASGRYIYRAGVFRTYNDVLSNLNKVKRQGFKSAYIVAFNNGQPLAVSKARTLEKQIRTVSVYQLEITPFDGILPDIAASAIRQISGKDIAKMEKDGKIVYIAGPFDDEEMMEKVSVAVRAAGVPDVVPVKIGSKEVKL